MPTEIYLVKVGMTMTEGIVDEWYVSDGEQVEAGAPVYRLETEKVNMDVEADVAGIVKHLVAVGTTMEPGDVVGWIYALDESIPEVLPTPTSNPNIASIDAEAETSPPSAEAKPALNERNAPRIKASPAARRLARERNVSLVGVNGSGPGGRILEQDVPAAEPVVGEKGDRPMASPAARRLATELGVDLAQVRGSGPRRRITKEDVEAASATPTAAVASDAGEPVPLRGMRKVIAERMFDSLRTTAQLTIDMEINMDDAVKLRTALLAEWEASDVRVTYTDLVIAASVKSLQSHGYMNTTFVDGGVQSHDAVHVGVAVALEEGLIVPVIHNADALSLQQRAAQAAELAARAREGSLHLDDVNGGTFTVTSLGMYGVDTFTPILNSPQTGILGVGRIYDTVRWENERPARTQCMRLSLTWDHRIVDGAPAAEFLREVKAHLEAPYRLLV